MSGDADPFAVPRWIDWLGGWVQHAPRLWRALGDFETRMLDESLLSITIRQPIYIAGLARSGSTILLELLNRHPATASQQYRDFPLIYTPWFWQEFMRRASRGGAAPVERAHGDGIRITQDSPEALEEMLWMGFFPQPHQPGHSDVLDAGTDAPAFERFYRNHLRKLLWLRGGSRYLAKGNYNLTRLEYLLKLFPDARFVVPVREPVAHVASLQRQHERFCTRQQSDPRALRYMQRLGHFEFGLDRRPIDIGVAGQAEQIREDWRRGDDIGGLARLWNDVHTNLLAQLQRSAPLREATLILSHEDLVLMPETTMRRLMAHCRLDFEASSLAQFAESLRPSSHADSPLSAAQAQRVHELTATTAAALGYTGAVPGL